MKKHLLLLGAALILGSTSFAQINSTDAPQIGDMQSLYVLDSSATAYANETGANATWDYSATTGYNSLMDTVRVMDAAQTDYDTSFTSADRALIINHFFMTYFNNPTSTEKKEQGFVFINSDTTIPIGDIVVPFDAAVENLQYPMQLNDEVQTNFQGTASVTIYANPQNPATITPFMKGHYTVKLDGKGTLKLASHDYTNVYRYKIEEHAAAYVAELSDSAHFGRVQYEYYDLSKSKLPIFIHSSAQFSLGTDTLIDVRPVLSYEDPATAGISENTLSKFMVYPNPADQKVTLQLKQPAKNATVSIVDNLGREVYSTMLSGMKKTLNINTLNKGIYFIRIANGQQNSTQKLVVK